LESWQDVGELLEAATPEERLQILQHYIEVVELGPIDSQTRTGTYAMRLFPEVRPDRGFDFGSGGNGPNDPAPGPQTTNGAVPAIENGSALVNLGRLGSHNRPESSPTRTRTLNLAVNRHESCMDAPQPNLDAAKSLHQPPALHKSHYPDTKGYKKHWYFGVPRWPKG
jgi:hypothetical protein